MTRAAVLTAIAIVLALTFTASFGSANQTTYLLDPLHRAQPELFQRDWFVATPPYLPAFGWLAQWLFRIDPDGITSVLAAHVIVMIATYAALYWLVAAVSTDLRACLIIAGFSTLTMGRAMAGSYLMTPYLQLSSLATLGWIFAIAALLRGRYLLCGILLALAGAVHANYMLLGFGLFALAGLARRGVTLRQAAYLLAPQLVVLAWTAPELLGAAGASDEAVRILVDFHAPGHYSGPRLAVRIPEVTVWLVAAFAALRLIGEPSRELRMLWRFSLIAGAISVATAALVLIPALQPFARAFWWRITPYGQLGCQVIVVVALMRSRSWMSVLFIVAVVVTFLYLHSSVVMMIVAAGVIAIASLVPRHGATVLAIAALIGALWTGPRGLGLRGVPEARPTELGLARWTRANTHVDALFVVPPELGRFRLLARRAIVADLKSPPLRPDLLVDWYRRLCAMVMVDSASSQDEIVARYAKLAPSELETVARRFGAEFVVVRASSGWPRPPEFANASFAVYRVSTP